MNKYIKLLIIAVFFLFAEKSAEAKCYINKRTCTDSGTKLIDGVSVYRGCWNWNVTYVCEGGGTTPVTPSPTGTGVPTDCDSGLIARSKDIIGNSYQDCYNEMVCVQYEDITYTKPKTFYCTDFAKIYDDRICNVWEIIPTPPPPPPDPEGCSATSDYVDQDVVGPHGLLVDGVYFLNPEISYSPSRVFDTPDLVINKTGDDGRAYVLFYSNKIFVDLGLDNVVWVPRSDGTLGLPSDNLQETGEFVRTLSWTAYEKVNGFWQVMSNPPTTNGACKSCHIQFDVPQELYTCNEVGENSTWDPPPPVYDEGECRVWMETRNCQLKREDCLEYDEWGRCSHYERAYICPDIDDMSGCENYENNSSCSLLSSSCTNNLPSGDCQAYDRSYSCPSTDIVRECVAYENRTVCPDDLYCLDPNECSDTTDDPDKNFGTAVVMVSAMNQMGKDFDQDSMTVFKADEKACSISLMGLVNCCDSGGMLFDIMNAMDKAYSMGGLPSKLSGMYGAYSSGGMGAVMKGMQSGIISSPDPVSLGLTVANYALEYLLACTPHELELSFLVEAGMCHYVGTRTKTSILGIALKKEKVYCCFKSKLSQVIQEQGRVQLGKSWGTGDNPDCGGFTLEEIQQIDFTQIDFSEYLGETVGSGPEAAELAVEIDSRIQQFYQGGGTGTTTLPTL